MFSVVIPLYNKEKSIKNTIDSVLNQTFQDFEIVIVNDGSTDNSLKIVSEINHPKIKIINQENEGVSAARNKGIESASFPWIAFLDGDDLWKENHLEVMNKLIQKYSHNQFFATSFVRTDGREMPLWKPDVEDYVVEDYFEGMLNQHLVWTGILVIHRSIFDMLGGFNTEINMAEDIELWARIGKVLPLVKSNRITATYRLEAENRSLKVPKDFDKSYFSLIKFDEFMRDSERQYYRKLLITMMKTAIKSKEWKMAYTIFKKHKTDLI